MNKQLDACFDRVEKALGTLIDSIAKYNPSTNQVQELGNADAELAKGLKDLQTHQSNYQRVQDLRAATARYDAQIKAAIEQFMAAEETRKCPKCGALANSVPKPGSIQDPNLE
ncbi:hypothetical protein NUW58_g9370 [Xylaria curta]|uniref:Uncharacterized protein n=1 Tax=Xylaria curta TaxID=42375 RepID=A0ACC1MXR7_9PEZI|nr:hypothetical protein NUW58_g9370 [Xylaria curta]